MESYLVKLARIATAQERLAAKRYREMHKAQLNRKAKKRRRMIAAGVVLPKTRVGTAAGGYSFVVTGGPQARTSEAELGSAARGPADGGWSTTLGRHTVLDNDGAWQTRMR